MSKSLQEEEEEEEDDDNNFFITKKKADLIDFVTNESGYNAFNQEYMNKLRVDSHAIASEPELYVSILNGIDGIVENDMYGSRQLLGTYLQEHHVIASILEEKGVRQEEPLFQNWQELKDVAKQYKLTEHASKKLGYLEEVQKRSKAISLMVKLLRNEKVDEAVIDYERRSDSFFNILYNNKESLFLKGNLLFRCRFPQKGEKHSFLLCLEKSDGERRLVSLHAREHRGHLYTWALFNRDYYTPGSFQLAYDVVSRCPTCSQMK